jgi:SPP1 gp7 family putative phage head morphogenesis protein
MRLQAEEALNGKLNKLFSTAEKKTLRQFLKTYNPDDILSYQVHDILQPVYDLEPKYTDTVLYENIRTFRRSRKFTLNLINLQLGRDEQLTLFDYDQKAYDHLARQTFTASARTMRRVTDNIKYNIAQSYQEGIGIKDAARRLQKEFNSLKTFEARRIARTEINSAQNLGSYQTYMDYDLEYHQWWTGQDARVRDSHRAMHGEIVEVGRPFSNGLYYPGDRSGPLKEWINCRCTTVPYLMPLGYMAPPVMSRFKEVDIVRIPGFEIPRITL